MKYTAITKLKRFMVRKVLIVGDNENNLLIKNLLEQEGEVVQYMEEHEFRMAIPINQKNKLITIQGEMNMQGIVKEGVDKQGYKMRFVEAINPARRSRKSTMKALGIKTGKAYRKYEKKLRQENREGK